VSNDQRNKVSVCSEVNSRENSSVDDVFDNSGRTLRKVSEAEQQRDEDCRYDSGALRFTKDSCDPIREIAAINRFFAERC
jgi:hypothetical protein